MPATVIDSRIFGNLFSTAALREVWSGGRDSAKPTD